MFFQARETINPFYTTVPGIVQKAMDKFAKLTGRAYHLFDYVGAPDAERVVIIMGSGGETAEATVATWWKRVKKSAWSVSACTALSRRSSFLKALPKTVKSIAVLDRTKEPGAAGEPLYLDVINALFEGDRKDIKVIGGRYGLSSKEFTPPWSRLSSMNSRKPSPRIISWSASTKT